MIEKTLIRAVGAFGGTLGVTLMLSAPRSTVLPSSIIGMLGYVFYMALEDAGVAIIVGYFFSTVIIALICEICARVMRMPATIFLLSALVPLVPGYNFYCAMLALVENDGARAAAEGLKALQIVAAIAVGAAVTTVCFRALMRRAARKKA